MNNTLWVISDYVSNGYKAESLELISVIALLFGTVIIVIKNPISSLMCLIGLFGTIAVYLILTGLNFIGFSYLIVYIGAVVKRIIRWLMSNHAAWVKISLCKVHLTMNNLCIRIHRDISTYLGYVTVNLFMYSNIYSTYSKVILPTRKHSLICSMNNSKKYYSTLNNATVIHPSNEDFFKWFSGFSDAEGNFSIVVLKNKLGDLSGFSFRFSIELHVDDKDALIYIKENLNIGNEIAVYGNSCKFTVTHSKDIYVLIEIFDKYNLNTTKYLDYLDFKRAFKIYKERTKNEEIFNNILNIKKGMNNSRTNWDLPMQHQISITDYWLLGLIEGDGSFFLDRSKMEPSFLIAQSNIQYSLLEGIKDYLVGKLGFDNYSIFKSNNSSVIAVFTGKARNNSKSMSVLRITNVNVLTNYFIPYLDKMPFITKKGLDYKDFKLICKTVYNGSHRIADIKELILKLSYSMNNYRLSTNVYTEGEKLLSLPSKELAKLVSAKPTVRHLKDGRQFDIITGKAVNRRWTNCVFEVIKDTGEVSLASTLNEAAEIIGVEFRTISRHLALETLGDSGEYVTINKYKIRRVAVFYN